MLARTLCRGFSLGSRRSSGPVKMFSTELNVNEEIFENLEESAPEVTIPSTKVKELDKFGRAYSTGRRKTSVAQVWLSPGSGLIKINNKSFSDYFVPLARNQVLEPFIVTETAGKYDVKCSVRGGGFNGQAGAVVLGISKALEIFEPELRPVLKKYGLLVRDTRVVERKKFGLKKARKAFQWVKR